MARSTGAYSRTALTSPRRDIEFSQKAFDGNPDRTYLHDSRLMAADYALFGLFGLFLLTAIVGYIVFGIGKFTGTLM